jgi:hypothetical protein
MSNKMMVFWKTNAHVGRQISVTAAKSTNRHLAHVVVNVQSAFATSGSGLEASRK